MTSGLQEHRVLFSRWLENRVIEDGRGGNVDQLQVDPAGLFWAGRIAPEDEVMQMGLGERGERIEPCAIGLVVRPSQAAPWNFTCAIGINLWTKVEDVWKKSNRVACEINVSIPESSAGTLEFGSTSLAQALFLASGQRTLAAEIEVTVIDGEIGNRELEIRLVNTSPVQKKVKNLSVNFYEASLEIVGLPLENFLLADLPDSFRYDRRVSGWGINCGVEATSTGLRTSDIPTADQKRRMFWSVDKPEPNLSFEQLAIDPMSSLEELVNDATDWARAEWSSANLDARQELEGWAFDTRHQADLAAINCFEEIRRMSHGLELLRSNDQLLQSFRLMNEAIAHSAHGKYTGWRPFQIGFLLSTLSTITNPASEFDIAEIIWFATGGGKTETYLGLLVTAAFYDRLSGKRSGITAWSRFPLRMLSLQQTQRFADALAGAELAKRRHNVSGEAFSMGFFVGNGATPNSIEVSPKSGDFDPSDDEKLSKSQVLLRCPFCHEEQVSMGFNRLTWTLEHRCKNEKCPWPDEALPFYIVDAEIFRFLPTIVVGTLDKAASIALQAAMRGFVGPPWGICSQPKHGYVYAPRNARPNGCLVPGCPGDRLPLDQDPDRFGPSYRLQDELHLLRDSLGAVDSQYESIFDSIQFELTGRKPKILASSATLAGFEKQVQILYKRTGRAFPTPGPTESSSFWTSAAEETSRRYFAIAPRGVTVEFAIERIILSLQGSVRLLISDPNRVCLESGITPESVNDLISLYGVNVIYGNILRDLEATSRSFDTYPVSPLNTASLTGGTDFEDVRETLSRLDHPEPAFDDRIHVITASSMMSHGVDIDRLNVMVMIGVPLTAAEFIQATARVGRTYPGLVFVLHKVARERDAGVFRTFPQFVHHADRLVEPIPITRRSRRVVRQTVGGAAMARIHAIHEPRSHIALTRVSRLKDYLAAAEIDPLSEAMKVRNALGFDGPMDELIVQTIDEWFAVFFQNLRDPALANELPAKVLPWLLDGPMISLRDVEEQATVRD